MYIKNKALVVFIFIATLASTNVSANQIAMCAVNFNFMARSLEAAGGSSNQVEQMKIASKILGTKLVESYSESKAHKLIEKEILKLKSASGDKELMKILESNFDYCTSILRYNQ